MVDFSKIDLSPKGREVARRKIVKRNRSEMAKWVELFAEWHGKPLPDDYLVFDLETTGFRKDFDLPVAIGWCIVRGRRPIQQAELVLDWTRFPELVCPDWLREQLDRIRYALQDQGARWIYTPEYLAEHGKNPIWVLSRVQQLFQLNRESGASFVGHNAGVYDSELIEGVFKEYLGHKSEPFAFGDDEIYDTGCIEKAIQAWLIPYPDEKTLKQYFTRVFYNRQPGLKWNLGVCAERYGLLKKANIDPEKFHQGGTDALVTHLLFEELRACEKSFTSA